MNSEASPLGDDYDRWPRDPFELLSISPEATEREARLAYTRLIRRFKPEQFPEHFRVIRTAYESARRQIEWRSYRPDSGTWLPQEDEADANETIARGTHEPNRPQPLPRVDTLVEAWKLACSNDLETAYRQLVDATSVAAMQPRRYAMLYWLLQCAPHLDQARQPLDWLVHGLNALGHCAELAQLLHWELIIQPSKALSPVMGKLFKSSGDGPISLAMLYRWRWSALTGHKSNTGILVSDLQRASERWGEYSPASTEIVIEALKHLAWLRFRSDEAGRAFEHYCQVLKHIDIHHQSTWDLDQLELQFAAARDCQAWSKLAEPPQSMLSAIETYCRRGARAARQSLLLWLRKLIEEPRDGLNSCVDLAQNHGMVWHQVALLVQELDTGENYVDDEDIPLLEPSVFTFFDRISRKVFEDLRLSILEFCMREMISPQTMARVLLRQASAVGGNIEKIAATIADDYPLWLMYTGYRLCAEPADEAVIAATLL
jgi:hypothetical protein